MVISVRLSRNTSNCSLSSLALVFLVLLSLAKRGSWQNWVQSTMHSHTNTYTYNIDNMFRNIVSPVRSAAAEIKDSRRVKEAGKLKELDKREKEKEPTCHLSQCCIMYP